MILTRKCLVVQRESNSFLCSFWFQFIVNSSAKFDSFMIVRLCVLAVVFVDCLFVCSNLRHRIQPILLDGNIAAHP